MQNKKIYLYNDFPDESNILLDEIKGFNPIILNSDVSKLKYFQLFFHYLFSIKLNI